MNQTVILLTGQEWLTAPATRRVISALNGVRPDCARFVGGCVRNALMSMPVSDIDIATQLEPEQVITTLRDEGMAVHKTGIEHGTVTAVANGATFEITTLRRDVSTDGRRATIAFTHDWVEDARRRDFRFNALYAEPNGRVHDVLGGGLDDINTRSVVFIGPPERRIEEDYLRILRFFRFFAIYGRDAVDEDGLAACGRMRDGLYQISAERIWTELKKLLSAKDPRDALKAMQDCGVLQIVLPDVWGLGLVDMIVAQDLEFDLTPDPLVRLMAMFSKDADLMDSVAGDLKLSNSERRRLIAASEDETSLSTTLDDRDFRRVLYRLGEQTFHDRARLAWASRPDSASSTYWLTLLNAIPGWDRPHLPVHGEDVIAAGIPPGPRIGEVLRRVEDWWVEQDFPEDAERVKRQMMEFALESPSDDD